MTRDPNGSFIPSIDIRAYRKIDTDRACPLADSMSITIKPAILDDLPVLKAFEQGIIRAERPFDPSIKPDPVSYYDLAAIINDAQAEIMIAVQNDEIIGSGSVIIKSSKHYIKPDRHAYLGFMFVPETHRGKGINKLIMEACVDWAKARGLSDIRLTVYSGNAAAIRAYEKAGFNHYMTEMRIMVD